MSEDLEIEKSRMVKSHDVHLDAEYADWIAELKHRYRAAQVKASVRVNTEKLRYNWELGRDLVQKKAEERWCAGVVEQVVWICSGNSLMQMGSQRPICGI